MNNALVYSMHVDEGDVASNYSFEQLKLSVSTLRKYNKDLKVLVYISPKGILGTNKFKIDNTNLEFVEYNADYDKRLNNRIYSIWTSHKWANTFHALRTGKFDNVIYMDSDTIFQKDPAYLFEKYGNTKTIYGKKDVSDTWLKVFNVRNGGMNDGVFLISKKALKYEKGLLEHRVQYVYDLQEKFKDETDPNIVVTGVQWVACQYAMSEYMLDQNNPIKFFDDEDVYVVGWLPTFKDLSFEEKTKMCVIHYLSYNMWYFAPNAFKVYEKARGRG
jgi:Glycosyl transferase family 8